MITACSGHRSTPTTHLKNLWVLSLHLVFWNVSFVFQASFSAYANPFFVHLFHLKFTAKRSKSFSHKTWRQSKHVPFHVKFNFKLRKLSSLSKTLDVRIKTRAPHVAHSLLQRNKSRRGAVVATHWMNVRRPRSGCCSSSCCPTAS